MMGLRWDPLFAFLALTCSPCLVHAGIECTMPTKIFVLAGQSNMEGMGSVEHMRKLLNDTKTYDEYSTYWNETSHDWAERDDVFVKFNDQTGYLKVGFGAQYFFFDLEHFGPELGMRWVLGDEILGCVGRPMFFLKTAYGGRDLAIDFRPPSSDNGSYPDIDSSHYGWQYREMIDEIKSTLDRLDMIVPGHDKDVGFELAGFVWFQGWNDMISSPKVQEYEFKMANLIRDVREDLDAPMMSVIIGGMGQYGVTATGRGAERYYAMQKAQEAVTLYDEFRNNTLYVSTAEIMDYPGNDTYNGEYHYDGRADVYTHIGRALGLAMSRLLRTEKGRDVHGDEIPPCDGDSCLLLL